MKIDTILVPTDFSEDAYKAAEAAVEFAKRFEARIVLLHAYHVSVPIATPMGGGYALPPGFYDQLQDQATSQIENAAKQLAVKEDLERGRGLAVGRGRGGTQHDGARDRLPRLDALDRDGGNPGPRPAEWVAHE